jgi:HEPN domain-containing protein
MTNCGEAFYGLLELDPPLECVKEVLGQKYQVSIGSVSGYLEVPSQALWGADSRSDPLRVPLEPPASAATWKCGDQPLMWGFPMQYPDGWSRVSKALLVFEVEPNQRSHQAAKVHAGFFDWYVLLRQYLELIKKQCWEPSIQVHEHQGNLDLFWWASDGRPNRSYKRDSPSITVSMHTTAEHLLTPDQLTKICAFASSYKKPALCYRVQLEAYRALRGQDYRKAVIDTVLAAELVLTMAVKRALSDVKTVDVDGLLKKFQGCARRLELARIVGISLPERDYKKGLLTPRNEVSHGPRSITREVAQGAIQLTDELLELLCPDVPGG